MVEVTMTQEVVLKGHRIRRVENHCSGWENKVKYNKREVLCVSAYTASVGMECEVLYVCAQTLYVYGMWGVTCLHTEQFLCVWNVRCYMFVHRPASMSNKRKVLHVCTQTSFFVHARFPIILFLPMFSFNYLWK